MVHQFIAQIDLIILGRIPQLTSLTSLVWNFITIMYGYISDTNFDFSWSENHLRVFDFQSLFWK